MKKTMPLDARLEELVIRPSSTVSSVSSRSQSSGDRPPLQRRSALTYSNSSSALTHSQGRVSRLRCSPMLSPISDSLGGEPSPCSLSPTARRRSPTHEVRASVFSDPQVQLAFASWGGVVDLNTKTIQFIPEVVIRQANVIEALKSTDPKASIMELTKILDAILAFWGEICQFKSSEVCLVDIFSREFIDEFNRISPLKLGDRLAKEPATNTPARVVCGGIEYPINSLPAAGKVGPVATGSFSTVRRIQLSDETAKALLINDPQIALKKTYLKNLKEGERDAQLHPTPSGDALYEAHISQLLIHPCLMGAYRSIIAPNSKGTFTVYTYMEFVHGPELFVVIKPENMLTDMTHSGELRIRLADFGLSAFADDRASASRIRGSAEYYAPETAATQIPGHPRASADPTITKQSDAWGLGMLIMELFTMHPFYMDRGDGKTLLGRIADHKSVDVLPNFHDINLGAGADAQTQQLRLLVCELLHEDPAQRATAQDALRILREIAASFNRPVML